MRVSREICRCGYNVHGAFSQLGTKHQPSRVLWGLSGPVINALNSCRGSVIAIDSAVPRKEDALSGLPREDPAATGLLEAGGMEGYTEHGDAIDFANPDISRPARHHGLRQGYKPY